MAHFCGFTKLIFLLLSALLLPYVNLRKFKWNMEKIDKIWITPLPADSVCGVGTQGSKQTMYYCEVTDNQKKFAGGGVGDEIIDVVEYSVDEAREMFYAKSNKNSKSFFWSEDASLHTKR
uniref:Uncharacterized protein n=1 Tax=Glossina austeni TaxID=7395 RepID=A0A1A9UXE1_GLOAU